MKRSALLVLALFVGACDKTDTTGKPSDGSKTADQRQHDNRTASGTNTTPNQGPGRNPAPTADPHAAEAKTYQEAAERILSGWREGHKSDELISTDFVDRNVLLDYKIVGLHREQVTPGDPSAFNYNGTVNLQLETQGGTPATRQYKIIVTENAGKWEVLLGKR